MEIKEINATTGEEIVRQMNAEELAAYEFTQQAIVEERATAATKAAEKAAAFAKLGLTADEVAALLS